jgi:hypothetical protein
MKKIFIIFMLLFLSIQFSCIFDGPPIVDPPVDQTKYGHVNPTNARLGTKLKFFNTDSTDYPFEDYKILFTGIPNMISPDSVTTAGMFTAVPFGVRSGQILLIHGDIDSANIDDLGGEFPMINCDTVVINGFTINEVSSEDEKRITFSDLNYTITEANSKYRAVTPDEEIVWIGEISGDTTRLSTSYTAGGVDYTHHITFYSIRGDSILPELMNAYSDSKYVKAGVEYPEFDLFIEGIVKLQDWRPGNLVSGKIISPIGDLNNYDFWCDFSE